MTPAMLIAAVSVLSLSILVVLAFIMLRPHSMKKRGGGLPESAPRGDRNEELRQELSRLKDLSPVRYSVRSAEAEPLPLSIDQVHQEASLLFEKGRLRECLAYLVRHDLRWGIREAVLALRCCHVLGDHAQGMAIISALEKSRLADSSLLRYLGAIMCERAGLLLDASEAYGDLLRLHGGHQDVQERFRRYRTLEPEEVSTIAQFASSSCQGRLCGGPGAVPAGGVIAERFQLVRPLGIGGMGVVFLAKDLRLDREVALKRLRAGMMRSSEAKELFLKEARMLAELRHPRIVEFYGSVEHDGVLYLVLEYIDGDTLRTELAFRGALPTEEVVGVLRAVAEALRAAHDRKIIHRDLKPGNIAVGAKGAVKVMDFGLARRIEPDTECAQELDVSGTPAYMAPEQHSGLVMPQSDIFSFGMIAYEMITGRIPFQGPAKLFYSQKLEHDYPPLEDVAPRLRGLIDQCLRADPGQRPPSAAELLAALR
ncbi:MAG: serine/threonine protein kinase [Elusimicrobia bacterium]|nr:serine/threonine protein kinase [Elusimicrobiota bacterium]